MKNKKRTAAVLLIIFLVIIASVLAVCNTDKAETSGGINMGVDIYYAQKGDSRLVSENREIDGVSVYGMALSALEKMREMPKNENLVSAIPSSVAVTGISVSQKNINVDLSDDYLSLSAGQEMMCRSAIVWTLTGLYFVDGVSISVSGNPIKKTNGEDIGIMTRENLIINAEIDPEPTNSSKKIVLYFTDSSAQKLVKEERRIEVNTNDSIEKYVMEALIAGPQEQGHLPTVPSETKIRDIKTADGICYVDLSEDFVTKHSGTEQGELLTIYSIVDTLTQLPNIEKVQFLIEGEKRNEFKGNIEFDKPFAPKEIDG